MPLKRRAEKFWKKWSLCFKLGTEYSGCLIGFYHMVWMEWQRMDGKPLEKNTFDAPLCMNCIWDPG
jgi:hypothetical protein